MNQNFKEIFVNEGLDKMANCLRKSLPLKILVNTDKKSLYYFNQNLLTPAEFLNSLELHVSGFLEFVFRSRGFLVVQTNSNQQKEPLDAIIRLEEQQGKRVHISKMNIKFIDIEESNNFDKNYLFKDLLKTISENAPTLDQIDSLQGIHFCPHATIWPLEHLDDIRHSIRQGIERKLSQNHSDPPETPAKLEKSVRSQAQINQQIPRLTNLSSSTQATELEPLPNLRFKQHDSLFLTKTKKKAKFAEASNQENGGNFDKSLGEGVTPENYFDACFNFHSKMDTRIDMKNFSKIKSDVRQLFGPEQESQKQTNSSNTADLRINDLRVLVESLSQEKALSQSTFDRDMESQLSSESGLHPLSEEGFAKLSESGTRDEDDLKQSFVSFLGTKNESGDNKDALDQIPNLLADIKFEKKLNFSNSGTNQIRTRSRQNPRWRDSTRNKSRNKC